jgi:hypothetical protein
MRLSSAFLSETGLTGDRIKAQAKNRDPVDPVHPVRFQRSEVKRGESGRETTQAFVRATP